MAPQQPSRAVTTPTRRALLGAAAWSVPVVAVATAAPAYAASTTATLAFTVPPTSGFIRRTDPTTGVVTHEFHGATTLANTGAATTRGLELVVTLPGPYASLGDPRSLSVNDGAGGWSFAGGGASGGQYVYRFTPATQLAPRTSTTASFRLVLAGTLPASLPPIVVNAAASNATGVAASSTPTLS